MIKIAFTLIGRGNWSGGETYLRNMLGVIASELKGEVGPYLFLSPAEAEIIRDSFDPLLAAPPIVSDVFDERARARRIAIALLTGKDREAERVFAGKRIDVVLESAHFYGWRFAIPLLSWIPDFQHRRLPHYFSSTAWWKRDLGFQAQTRSNRTIMLSSADAERDCLEFYPGAKGKTAIVRFAVDVDPVHELAREHEIRTKYQLPERFFYLPSQFWAHKNHKLVVEALARIRRNTALEALPPIALTGRTEDPRNPGIFESLMESAKAVGVESHFRYLGLVPYADVFGLNAASHAMINPSTFEGWSTPVEEAKALGTRMILSAIGLHREQAPQAMFFDPENADSLASALLEAAKSGVSRKPAEELAVEHRQRRRHYADALLAAFQKAAARNLS